MKAFALHNLNMSMTKVENVANFHMRIMMKLINCNLIVGNVKKMLQWIVLLIKDVMIVSLEGLSLD